MTPPDDVSTRLAEIRERVEAATEGPEVSVQIESLEPGEGIRPIYNLYTHAEADQRLLLSWMEDMGEVFADEGDDFWQSYMRQVREGYGEDVAEVFDALRDAALQAEEEDDG